MSAPDIKLCSQIFNELDTDKSGKLDVQELVIGLNKTGANVSKQDVEGMIRLMEQGPPDCLLNFKEFCQFTYVCEHADMNQPVSILFYLTDTDYNGTVDQDEFYNIMAKLESGMTRQEVEDLFKETGSQNGMTHDVFMTQFGQ